MLPYKWRISSKAAVPNFLHSPNTDVSAVRSAELFEILSNITSGADSDEFFVLNASRLCCELENRKVSFAILESKCINIPIINRICENSSQECFLSALKLFNYVISFVESSVSLFDSSLERILKKFSSYLEDPAAKYKGEVLKALGNVASTGRKQQIYSCIPFSLLYKVATKDICRPETLSVAFCFYCLSDFGRMNLLDASEVFCLSIDSDDTLARSYSAYGLSHLLDYPFEMESEYAEFLQESNSILFLNDSLSRDLSSMEFCSIASLISAIVNRSDCLPQFSVQRFIKCVEYQTNPEALTSGFSVVEQFIRLKLCGPVLQGKIFELAAGSTYELKMALGGCILALIASAEDIEDFMRAEVLDLLRSVLCCGDERAVVEALGCLLSLSERATQLGSPFADEVEQLSELRELSDNHAAEIASAARGLLSFLSEHL